MLFFGFVFSVLIVVRSLILEEFSINSVVFLSDTSEGEGAYWVACLFSFLIFC